LHGLLRYLAGDAVAAARLAAAPRPEVSFNYLGRFDSWSARGRLFRPAAEGPGATQAAGSDSHHFLAINCLVAGGRFRATWSCRTGAGLDGSLDELVHGWLATVPTILHGLERVEEATGDEFGWREDDRARIGVAIVRHAERT
jgi:non-ribosomal peptide synthase protein (TIGR01720 family)